MQIIKGKVAKAQKVVIYGPEGIGKSSLAAQFPEPLFIDTEGSTNNMDVARLENPTSFQMLVQQVEFVKANKPCKTLVIDTIDWAERMITEFVCSKHNKSGVEEFGYGTGYTYVSESFGNFLNLLSDVIDVGINVVLTAHTQIKKFEQPDEMGAYDRYELKLGKKTSSQTAPLAKEWADMVLFCNYKTVSVAADDKGKKHKAQGGKRVIYTMHHPAWDAKNRHGLPNELDMDFAGIAHIFNQVLVVQENLTTETQATVAESAAVQEVEQPNIIESTKSEEIKAEATPTNTVAEAQTATESLPNAIPKPLQDLMRTSNLVAKDLLEYAARKGHYTIDTPFENIAPEWYAGVTANWDKVQDDILESKIPF